MRLSNRWLEAGAVAVAVLAVVALLQFWGEADLAQGNPPVTDEPLADATLQIEGRTVTIGGVRGPAETRVEVALPEDLALVVGPLLVHDGDRIPADRIEQTETGLLAVFPATESGAPLQLDLGPAVVVDDPFRTVVVTIALADVLGRLSNPRTERAPLSDEIVVEPPDVVAGDPALVAAVGRGVRLGTATSIEIDGTWHEEHGLLSDGNWPEEFARMRAQQPGDEPLDPTDDPLDPGDLIGGELRLFDEHGQPVRLRGVNINYTAGSDGYIGWGRSSLLVENEIADGIQRLTVVMQVEPERLEGDHTVRLVPAR